MYSQLSLQRDGIRTSAHILVNVKGRNGNNWVPKVPDDAWLLTGVERKAD